MDRAFSPDGITDGIVVAVRRYLVPQRTLSTAPPGPLAQRVLVRPREHRPARRRAATARGDPDDPDSPRGNARLAVALASIPHQSRR